MEKWPKIELSYKRKDFVENVSIYRTLIHILWNMELKFCDKSNRSEVV